MKTLLVALMLLPALAAGQDIVCTADTTLSLTAGWYESGPVSVDVATDGNGSITFYWFEDATREAVKSSRLFILRSAYPTRNLGFTAGPDSASIDQVTATEIIVTPQP